MKKETKTIIIGALLTLVVLALTLFTLYKVDQNKAETPNSNTNEKGEKPNNNEPASKEENNNDQENNQDDKIDVETENKVIVYLFHGETCPACQNALKTINEKKDTTFKSIEFITYEIHTKENSNLMSKVAEKLNVEARYIPFFVIGEFSTTGFSENTILEELDKAKNNKDYIDIVDSVIKENNMDIISEKINN